MLFLKNASPTDRPTEGQTLIRRCEDASINPTDLIGTAEFGEPVAEELGVFRPQMEVFVAQLDKVGEEIRTEVVDPQFVDFGVHRLRRIVAESRRRRRRCCRCSRRRR